MQLGTIAVTDPKGELLESCGYYLKKKGYTIKVLNLDQKELSNHYNIFYYVKEKVVYNEKLNKKEVKYYEDEVMVLVNTLMATTKSVYIENVTRRSVLGKSRRTIFTVYYLLYA